MPHFDTTYFEDHLYLLELHTIKEPQSQYSFDYTFQSINSELASYQQWEEEIDGAIPVQEVDCAPYNWYTQRWWNCAINGQTVDFDEEVLFDLFDYVFDYDETIYTNDFLDLY